MLQSFLKKSQTSQFPEKKIMVFFWIKSLYHKKKIEYLKVYGYKVGIYCIKNQKIRIFVLMYYKRINYDCINISLYIVYT